MDNPAPDGFWQYVAHIATAAALAIGAWVMKGHIKRVEELERTKGLYVTREELREYLDEMKEARQTMHEENRDSIEALTTRIDNILHRRSNG